MLEVGIGFVFTSVNPKLQRHTLVEPFGGRTQGCLRSKKHARQSRWEALSLVLPALFPKDKVDDDVGEGNGSDDDRPLVIVQGIEAPLSTPALWLCQQLASADTMLYISVRPAVSGSNADTS